MINRIELKENAKESLKNKWAEAIKVLLILLIINIGCDIIFDKILHFGIYKYSMIIEDKEVIYSINYISPIIDCIFTLGVLSFFIKISRNEDVYVSEIFSKNNMFFKFILASLLIGILVAFGTILLVIPGIIIAFSLSQVFYIILDNPKMNIIDAIKLSYKMMKGFKMDYFILCLSFIGWFIISVITIGLGFLYTIPYMQVTLANFYNFVKDEYNNKTE